MGPQLHGEYHPGRRLYVPPTKEEFIGRFKAFASMDANTAPEPAKGHNTVMSWSAFAGMTESDLAAIYDYLKTVKPIENKVVTFPDAK